MAEFNDPTPTRDGAKTDALDARRAARQVLGRTVAMLYPGPGETAKLCACWKPPAKSAQNARVTAINRAQSPGHNRTGRPQRPTPGSEHNSGGPKRASSNPGRSSGNELAATKQAHTFSSPTDPQTLTTEIAELKRIHRRTGHSRQFRNCSSQYGIGPVTAAQVYIAWSHPGRCRTRPRSLAWPG